MAAGPRPVYNGRMRLSPSAGRVRALAALALIALLPGCAELGQLAASAVEKPRVTFRAATLQALDLEGATVGVTFDVENPNGFGAKLARLDYRVEVDRTQVASGAMQGGLAIPANGKAPVTVPVRVRFRDVPGILQLLRKREAIGYVVSGAVGVQTPIGVIDVPVSHSDRLALPDLPRFSLEGLSIRSVSLSSVGLEVRLAMDNPNPFPIPAGTLDYALSIAGAEVLKAEGAATAMIPAGRRGVVTLPLRLDLARAGRAASELLRGGDVDVGLHGTAALAGIPMPLDLSAHLPARR